MSTEAAADLYGWYTGMVYLLPIFGGLIADKLIGGPPLDVGWRTDHRGWATFLWPFPV